MAMTADREVDRDLFEGDKFIVFLLLPVSLAFVRLVAVVTFNGYFVCLPLLGEASTARYLDELFKSNFFEVVAAADDFFLLSLPLDTTLGLLEATAVYVFPLLV